jgi:hypothetical protein
MVCAIPIYVQINEAKDVTDMMSAIFVQFANRTMTIMPISALARRSSPLTAAQYSDRVLLIDTEFVQCSGMVPSLFEIWVKAWSDSEPLVSATVAYPECAVNTLNTIPGINFMFRYKFNCVYSGTWQTSGLRMSEI